MASFMTVSHVAPTLDEENPNAHRVRLTDMRIYIQIKVHMHKCLDTKTQTHGNTHTDTHTDTDTDTDTDEVTYMNTDTRRRTCKVSFKQTSTQAQIHALLQTHKNTQETYVQGPHAKRHTCTHTHTHTSNTQIQAKLQTCIHIHSKTGEIYSQGATGKATYMHTHIHTYRQSYKHACRHTVPQEKLTFRSHPIWSSYLHA
jgi:hypothetical protein